MVNRKKVLMIGYAFPPRLAIGALRVAKFAKYLPQFGWEPSVITRSWEGERGLEEPVGVRVIRTAYRDRLRFFRRNRSSYGRGTPRQEKAVSQDWQGAHYKIASFWVKECLAYPDESIGWKHYALEAANKLLEEKDIALIYSTSPPTTSHLIASEIQQETGLPWVADFRDLWTQNHYVRHSALRRLIERRLEKKTLATAAILVTVSAPLAEKLGRFHSKSVEVITNGFDEDDYCGTSPPPTPYFSLTYTGQIYSGKRDPSLLLAAVQELLKTGVIDPRRFRIRFYGPDGGLVEKLAARFGVEEVVNCGGIVPYIEAVRRQRESTALLLLNCQAPEEKGVYTGKVFEYLGARRPILVIPGNEGVVDELMRETRAGIVAGTKEELTRVLSDWYCQFRETGTLAYQGEERVIMQYTRAQQVCKLAQLFDRIWESNK